MKIKKSIILVCVLITTMTVGCRQGSVWEQYAADGSIDSKQLYEMYQTEKKADQAGDSEETMSPWVDGSQSHDETVTAETNTDSIDNNLQADAKQNSDKENVNDSDVSEKKEKSEEAKIPKIAYIEDKSVGLEVLRNYEENERRRFSFFGLEYELANYHILQTVETGREINIYYEPDDGYNELEPVHVQIIEGAEYLEDERCVKDYFIQYEECEKIVHYKDIPDEFIKDAYVAEASEYVYCLIKNENRTLFIQTDYRGLKDVLFTDDLSAYITYESSIQEVQGCGMNGAALQILGEYIKNEKTKTYNLGKNKSGKEYTLVLTVEQKDYYTFTNNLKVIYSWGALQQFSWDSVDDFEPIFRDINLDGYMDLLITTASGVDTNIYNLYTWDSNDWRYKKVECEELASTKLDVQDGRIINWVKSGDGYNMIIFEWLGNSLVKQSEEYRISVG